MKRLWGILLCLVLLMAVTIPVSASGAQIIFTEDSLFKSGYTVTVDFYKTLDSTYNFGLSEEYNAYYEKNVQYYWMRDGVYYADGSSLTLTEADKGCSFYCVAALYSDMDHTIQCGTLYSDTYIVESDIPVVWPEILTTSVPNGTVGEYYYQKLECSDYDLTFSLLQSSLPDGLTLTQYGEIEGTPTKAGFWYVVVMAIPEAGEDYADTMEYEITIEETGPQYYLEILEAPDKVTYTAGETVDMDGLWVRIYTPDGFIDSWDGEYLGYSQKALTTLGEQKIKLTYEDAVEFFIVTVKAAPTEATTAPTEATTAPTKATTAPTEATTAPAKVTTTPTTEKTTVPATTASKEETKEADAQKTSKDAATAKSESTKKNSNDKSLIVPKPEKTQKSNMLPIIIGIVSGIAVLAVGSVVIFIIMKRRR